MPTLSQKRAADAYHKVDEITTQAQYQNIQKKYGSLARGISAMIQVNGLGPSLAFLRAKSKGETNNGYAVLYGHINSWLTAQVLPGTQHQPADFLQWVVGQSTAVYHIATQEALEYCVWLKRFAEAAGLASDDNQGDDQ